MLLEYDIASTTWKNHANPKTSAGENAEPDGIVIQRAAEGAGFSVASLGRAWYFGGHLDCYTTTGWSQSTPRVYLRSLIEYTFPGSKNSGVDDLRDGKTAGNDGTWRNITKSGVQNDAGFPERADGVLTYITGVGKQGILLGLAGGTNTTFVRPHPLGTLESHEY